MTASYSFKPERPRYIKGWDLDLSPSNCQTKTEDEQKNNVENGIHFDERKDAKSTKTSLNNDIRQRRDEISGESRDRPSSTEYDDCMDWSSIAHQTQCNKPNEIKYPSLSTGWSYPTPMTSFNSIRRSVLIPSATSAFQRIPPQRESLKNGSSRDTSIAGPVPASQHQICDGSRRQRSRDTSSAPRGFQPLNKNEFRYKSMDDFSQKSSQQRQLYQPPVFTTNRSLFVTKTRNPFDLTPTDYRRSQPTRQSAYLSSFKDSTDWSEFLSPEIPNSTSTPTRHRLTSSTRNSDRPAISSDHRVTSSDANDVSPLMLRRATSKNDDETTDCRRHAIRTSDSTSPCKLLVDIVRESHLSAFHHFSPLTGRRSRELLENTKGAAPEVKGAAPEVKCTCGAMSGLSENLSPPYTKNLSPIHNKSMTSSLIDSALHSRGVVKRASSPTTTAAIDRTPIVVSRAISVSSVQRPTTLTTRASNSITSHPARQWQGNPSVDAVQPRQERPAAGRDAGVDVPSAEFIAPPFDVNKCIDEFNAITDALDSAIARLTTNGFSSDSIGTAAVSTGSGCSSNGVDDKRVIFRSEEKITVATSKCERGTSPLYGQLGDVGKPEKTVDHHDRIRRTNKSDSTTQLQRSSIPDKARIRQKKLAAELQIVQRRQTFQTNKDDSFSCSDDTDSPIEQSVALTLPRVSVIKRHRERQRHWRGASSLVSSSSSSSSTLSSTLSSTESKHESSCRSSPELSDISPVANRDRLGLTWHAAQT